MKFSCIYCGQESFAELYEFIEEVLKIAKEFFLPPHPLQTRLCGLYLLYGLYYKQPTIEDGEYLVKIRLNFKEWQDSYSLMKFVCEEQHYDALFIFNKLLAENAFHFCAMPREYGLEKSMRKYLERNDTADENLSHKSELLTLEESGILNSLDEISKKYYELKCKLNNESKENKPHQLLDYASPMIADDIRKKLASAMDDSSDQKDEEQDTKISIGAHRKKLKEKACFGAGPSRST
ncbi:hypothetical protein B7P43_G16957 [Cryptotermes secundus]|uniref:snRNA-activating protein complex subunit 1 n=1 Tax=Cryptotermes secundus TaxID=105785 RepID=A0A2J7REI5_9NEOP|nr:hypothetical protein B7P43_G16957 [Cryptotermes secundus]